MINELSKFFDKSNQDENFMGFILDKIREIKNDIDKYLSATDYKEEFLETKEEIIKKQKQKLMLTFSSI